jgi:sulfate permease, SulP family
MEISPRLPLIGDTLRFTAQHGGKWEQLFAESVIGVLIGLVALAYAGSYAAVVFSGDLSTYVNFGVTSALIGTALVGLSLALKSSMRLAVVSLSVNNVAILPLVVAPVASAVRETGSESDVLATIMVAIGLSTALTGVFLLALGRLRLGRFVRLMPHAVVGGYSAGTGLLIFAGAFRIVTGRPISLDQLSSFVQASVLIRWLPGLVLAVILLLVVARVRHVVAVPVVLMGALVVFYASAWATGTSLEAARSQGWLLSPPSGGQWYAPLTPASFPHIHWAALSTASSTLAAFPVIAAIAVLLSTTGSEVATRQDGDLDHELVVNGISNIAGGLLGGLVAMQSQSLTTLAYNSRARGRAVGTATAMLCACALFVSGSLLSYVPTPILAGLLFFAGVTMVREWLYFGWFRLSHLDYLIVVVLLVVMTTLGLLQAVAAGLVIACFVFAFNYARIKVVKYELSGAYHRSNMARSFQQERLLARQGHQLAILILQGYIFFGTATTVYQRVRQLLEPRGGAQCTCVLMDFQFVNGLDASALRSFTKIRQAAEAYAVQLVFTHCSATISAQLRLSNILRDNDSLCFAFDDLDRGVEWWETQALDASSLRRQRYVPLTFYLDDIFPLPERVPDFVEYLEPITLPADRMLFEAGDALDAVYFIQAGQVTISTGMGRTARRLQTLGAGTVVGEMWLYQSVPETTWARADRETQLYRLSRESVQRMHSQDPELAAAVHLFMAERLAQHLARTDREVDLLLQ